MRLALLLVVSLLSHSASAFEGILHLDVVADGKTSRGRVLVRQAGDLRADFMLPLSGRTLNTSLIVLASDDSTLVHAVHDTSTFERRRMPPRGARDDRFVVERAGEVVIVGRRSQHYRVVDTKSGDRIEVWCDPSLDDSGRFGRIWSALRPDAGDLGAALLAAGAKGMPLRVSWDRRHGGRVYATVVEVSAETVPREAFDLPRGYREAPLAGVMSGGASGGVDGAVKGLQGLFGK